MMRSRVVFPDPLSPRTVRNSPSAISREMLRRTGVGPNDFATSWMLRRVDCSWRDLGLSDAGHLVCTHEPRKRAALATAGEMPARYCAAFTSFQISLYL